MKRSISLNEFWIRIFGITELIEYLRTKVSIGHLISEYEYLFRLGLSARISPIVNLVGSSGIGSIMLHI